MTGLAGASSMARQLVLSSESNASGVGRLQNLTGIGMVEMVIP